MPQKVVCKKRMLYEVKEERVMPAMVLKFLSRSGARRLNDGERKFERKKEVLRILRHQTEFPTN